MNTPDSPSSGIQWLNDLIRLEIALWDRVDSRLKEAHGLPLAFFESLHLIGGSSERSLRVGELAVSLGLTVGGTSKVVDRIERAGLIARQPDGNDRRASRITLTQAGEAALAASAVTYEVEIETLLDAALSRSEQNRMHTLVRRLLATNASKTTET
jgi:DNA-binding MarR family transcriptional regulator